MTEDPATPKPRKDDPRPKDGQRPDQPLKQIGDDPGEADRPRR